MYKVTVVKNKLKDAEWAAKIQECQASGLTIAKWCRPNEVDIKAYYYRLRKAREQVIEQIPVPINTEVPKIKSEVPLTISLQIGEAVMEIPDRMSERTIKAVVRALIC